MRKLLRSGPNPWAHLKHTTRLLLLAVWFLAVVVAGLFGHLVYTITFVAVNVAVDHGPVVLAAQGKGPRRLEEGVLIHIAGVLLTLLGSALCFVVLILTPPPALILVFYAGLIAGIRAEVIGAGMHLEPWPRRPRGPKRKPVRWRLALRPKWAPAPT